MKRETVTRFAVLLIFGGLLQTMLSPKATPQQHPDEEKAWVIGTDCINRTDELWGDGLRITTLGSGVHIQTGWDWQDVNCGAVLFHIKPGNWKIHVSMSGEMMCRTPAVTCQGRLYIAGRPIVATWPVLRDLRSIRQPEKGFNEEFWCEERLTDAITKTCLFFVGIEAKISDDSKAHGAVVTDNISLQVEATRK